MRTFQLLPLTIALAVSLTVPYSAANCAPGFTTLYSFTGRNGDGSAPEGNLAIGKGGVLYGTTSRGGIVSSACSSYGPTGCGTVFELTPPASAGGAWMETVLHSFTGQDGDGWYPFAGVVIGRNGVLYGTTYFGGAGVACPNTIGCGTVFQLKPPAALGGAWTETVLHSFTGQNGDGSGPEGNLVMDSNGTLYGMTLFGGTPTSRCPNGCGVVFELRPPAAPGGIWTETVIHRPSGQSLFGGLIPDAGLTIGEGGVLYGTASVSGPPGSYGTVFELRPPAAPGGAWTESVIFSFNLTNGATPTAGVTLGNNGALYGTTAQGGTGSCPGLACGTVFELTPPAAPGGAWTETVLCNLGSDCLGGAWEPLTRVVIGKNGVLFGTTFNLGGLLFAMKPPAAPGGAWTPFVLHSFNGADPSGLAVGDNGVVYGSTLQGGSCCGTLFAWTP